MLVPQFTLGPLAPESWVEVAAGFVFLGLLWLVFSKFVSPMFEKMYQDRASQIEGGIMRAQKAEADAAAAKAAYDAQLANARQDAAKLRDDAKAEADALSKQLHAQATQDAARLLEQARAQAAAEQAAARLQLQGEIGGLATTLAGRIVDSSLIDPKRAQSTIDQFLADLATIAPKEAASA